MPNNDKFNAPDADIILRALGPPKRDFRVHKLVLSLASPVFKDMFSLPQPTPNGSRESTVTEVEIVEVTDPAGALDIVLKMIYPFVPPPLDGDLNTLVKCLIVAEKYKIEGAGSQLYRALVQMSATHPLRVYATAARFGFTNLIGSTSRHIFSSVHLLGIPELPDDFDSVSATAYHRLVRQRAAYLEAAVGVIKQTPLKSWCSDCPGTRYAAEEVSRLRLAHLVITGTPVEAGACFEAWVKAYGKNTDCEEDCIPKFIRSAITRVCRKSLEEIIIEAD
jgi:hypothetical protein